MAETLQLRGTLAGHNGWVTQGRDYTRSRGFGTDVSENNTKSF